MIKLLVRFCYFCAIIGASMGIALVLYSATLLSSLPTVKEIQKIPLSYPLRIYSSDGELIGEYGNERRSPVTIDNTPQLLIDSLLATEDDAFYNHIGVDFFGIGRAALSNLRSGTRGQGASTITMQVARNFFLTPEKSYKRKLTEILLAFNMERALTKDEILELYLNKIFLGHRAYGFEAAAQVYYGENLENLSVPELAMLAGLPKAPSRDNPLSNPERAKERRNYVLKRLLELDRIDAFAYENAINAPITAGKSRQKKKVRAPYVSELVRQYLFEAFGESVYEMGLNVTVTVDSRAQQKANYALRKGLIAYDQRHGYRGPLAQVNVARYIDADTDAQNELLDEWLDKYPSSFNIQPALVTTLDQRSFIAVLSDNTKVQVDWPQIEWARQFINSRSLGPKPEQASDVVAPGDIVYVRQVTKEFDPVDRAENIANDESEIPISDDEPETSTNYWELSQIPDVSGALVSLDPNSGEIIAISGGFDYFLSKFNRATQAFRQPGSNIKPLIYSASFEHGFTPATPVSAGPLVIADVAQGSWRPENYSKKFSGPTRLRKALSLSLNLVSVRLVRAIEIEPTREHLMKFGLPGARLPQALALALGSASVTPLEMASAYGVFATEGKWIKPFLIKKIEDVSGNPVYLDDIACIGANCNSDAFKAFRPGFKGTLIESGNPAQQVISEENAFLTRSIMESVIRAGTATRAKSLNRADLAGKTGTTNDAKDAWFTGFSSDVVTSVYVGFDQPKNMGRGESGSKTALPIWVDFMRLILPDYPERNPEKPENIISRFVNKETGMNTHQNDPNGYYEYFMAGSEPKNPVINTQSSETIKDDKIKETLF